MLIIKDGVYIHYQSEIIEDQKQWAEEDKQKHTDFTQAPYWFEEAPLGLTPLHSMDELVGALEKHLNEQ